MTRIALPGGRLAETSAQPLLPASVGGCFALLVFLVGWPVYMMDVHGGIRAADYYVAILALALVSGCIALYRDLTILDDVIRQPLIWCVAAYLLVSMLGREFAVGDPEFVATVWQNRFVAFLCFVAVLVLARVADARWLFAALAGALLFNAALYWVDVLNPGLLLPLEHPLATPGRATGFHMNANEAASMSIVGAIGLLSIAPPALRIPIFVVMFAGVLATFSRSAIIISVLLVGFAVATGILSRKAALTFAMVMGGLVVAYVGVLALLVATVEAGSENLLGRVMWFSSAGREVDGSAANRLEAAGRAFDMFLAAPLTGRGFAATLRDDTMSPHNMFLMLAGEQGLLAVAWYALFLGLMLAAGMRLLRGAPEGSARRLRGLCLVALFGFFLVQSLFSHNLLDRPALYAILAVLLVSARPRTD